MVPEYSNQGDVGSTPGRDKMCLFLFFFCCCFFFSCEVHVESHLIQLIVKYSDSNYRPQAVPFWIVGRSREIAEREKPGANERRGAWGEISSRLFLLGPVSLRCERTFSTYQKGTACNLFQLMLSEAYGTRPQGVMGNHFKTFNKHIST